MSAKGIVVGATALLAVGAGVATAQCMGATSTGFDFAPAPNALFETDFREARGSAPPRGIRFVSGGLAMADWEGQRAIQATSRATILVPTPPLSEDFSIEIGLVHRATRQIAGPSISVYGGRTENFYPGTSSLKFEYGTVYWQGRGGGANATAQFSSDETAECVGAPVTFRLQGEGADIKAYAGERLLSYMQDVKFNRSGGVLIEVGAGPDDNAVYITSIRVGGAGAGIAAGVGTVAGRPTGIAAGSPADGTGRGISASPPAAAPGSAPAAAPVSVGPDPVQTGVTTRAPATVQADPGTPAPTVPVVARSPTSAPAERASTSATDPTTVHNQPIAATRQGVRAPSASARGGGAEPDPVPSPPTNVAAHALSGGTVLVRWDPAPGAVGYSIVRYLPDGKFVGANLATRPEFGGSDTAGVTMQLEFGVQRLAVLARYESGQSIASVPVTVDVPRWFGKYRISVLGFQVERETLDDPMETDGKRDEIYVRAAIAERDADAALIGQIIERQTLVHGDINTQEWRNPSSPNHRIRAGSASGDGGLKTGDKFPTAEPWKRSSASNYLDRFPLRVWEGDLYQGMNTVQVALSVWETDQRPGQRVEQFSSFSPERAAVDATAAATRRLEPSVAGQVVTAAAAGVLVAPAVLPLLVLSAPSLPFVVASLALDAAIPRPPVVVDASSPMGDIGPEIGQTAAMMGVENAVGSVVSSITTSVGEYVDGMISDFAQALNVRDRPIGIRQAGNRVVSPPWMLTLNFENAEAQALSGLGPDALGRGVYAVRFEDRLTSAGANGIYTLYVQVERIY